MSLWAIVVAAGRGERFGSRKQFVAVRGRMVVEWALSRLAACPSLAGLVAVLPDGAPPLALDVARGKPLRIVRGGPSRALSVRSGLGALPADYPDDRPVLVHDGVRPCVEPTAVERLIAEAGKDPCGGLLAVPVSDSLKRAVGDRVEESIERRGLWRAQTPQLFPRGVLQMALARPGAEAAGDEAELAAALGLKPRLVLGSESNLKITRPEDLVLAEAVLALQEASC